MNGIYSALGRIQLLFPVMGCFSKESSPLETGNKFWMLT